MVTILELQTAHTADVKTPSAGLVSGQFHET